jgi:hypothetical protein
MDSILSLTTGAFYIGYYDYVPMDVVLCFMTVISQRSFEKDLSPAKVEELMKK